MTNALVKRRVRRMAEQARFRRSLYEVHKRVAELERMNELYGDPLLTFDPEAHAVMELESLGSRRRKAELDRPCGELYCSCNDPEVPNDPAPRRPWWRFW